MRRLAALAAIVALGATLIGCPRERYTLRLALDGDQLRRELTVEGLEKKQIPPAELRALRKLYQTKPQKLGQQKYRVAGRFRGTTPDDIGGGNGSLHVAASSLGQAYSYLETFRGDDDPAAQIEARFAAVDQLVELGRGWLEQELGDRAGFAKLDRFITTVGRNDLRALMVYSWLEANAATESGDLFPPELPGARARPREARGFTDGIRSYRELRSHGVDARMLQFAVARGYGTPSGLSNLDEPDQILELFRRVLVKAGVEQPDPLLARARELLADPARSERSIYDYVRSTPGFREFSKKRKQRSADKQAVDDYLKALKIAELLTLFPIEDELAVVLATGVEPAETNGRWDPASNSVRWDGRIAERAEQGRGYHSLPDICYASWAQPDLATQTRQFGKVVLEGPELFGYTYWYQALSGSRRDAWDEFLARLTTASIEQLLEFKFAGDELLAVHEHGAVGQLYRAVSGKPLPDPPRPDADRQPTP